MKENSPENMVAQQAYFDAAQTKLLKLAGSRDCSMSLNTRVHNCDMYVDCDMTIDGLPTVYEKSFADCLIALEKFDKGEMTVEEYDATF